MNICTELVSDDDYVHSYNAGICSLQELHIPMLSRTMTMYLEGSVIPGE